MKLLHILKNGYVIIFFQNIAAHNGAICLYKNHILHTKPLSLNLYSFNKRGALQHDSFFLSFLQCNIKNNTQTQIYLLIIIWSYNSFLLKTIIDTTILIIISPIEIIIAHK